MRRQLPFLPITYWTSHDIKSTPLSDAITPFVGSHEHDWQFIHGSGNGILCALGDGGPIYSVARSEQLAAFLVATRTHISTDAANHWRFQAVNPDRSKKLRSWLDANAFPTAPLNREAYLSWRAKADQSLEIFEGLTKYEPPNVAH